MVRQVPIYQTQKVLNSQIGSFDVPDNANDPFDFTSSSRYGGVTCFQVPLPQLPIAAGSLGLDNFARQALIKLGLDLGKDPFAQDLRN